MTDDPYMASMVYFAGNFAPRGWALCQGQIISIAQNTALFSLLGTTYGGNGQTTFALPDLRSRSAIGTGQGSGLSYYALGEVAGQESFTIQDVQFPTHTHGFTGVITMPATAAEADSDTPQNTYPAKFTGTDMYSTTQNGSFMGAMKHNLAIGNTGSRTPVGHLQPYLCLNVVIALEGIFPSRN